MVLALVKSLSLRLSSDTHERELRKPKRRWSGPSRCARVSALRWHACWRHSETQESRQPSLRKHRLDLPCSGKARARKTCARHSPERTTRLPSFRSLALGSSNVPYG